MSTTAGDRAATRRPGTEEPGRFRSYYGQPVVKEPEWTWEVPWYLFAGGLAGASSGLALGARLTGRARLAERARLVAAAGALASPALLVADLGRPARFFNMLRVFKPTSAMSMGSWILALYAPAAAGAGLLRALGRLPRVGGMLEEAAAALGLPMATYTAVLVADSSIPVWHEARRDLPFVFAGSAAMTAGAAATLLSPAEEAGPARRLALAGAVTELAAAEAMQRRLGEIGEVYEQGDTGRFQKAAKACTATGAGVLAIGGGARSGRRRAATLAGSALLLAGGLAQRWAVYRAGFASARDPKYVVKPQRQRLETGDGHR
ncbi:MAG TPA: NrfD/PsrC family molybdoenzyme membrane anchor subunit [Egibacteraceae bacterium]|nr:NrfD/PsrC family molybdoenzyme membrane anchor subunit [Egibacteraceae bacterium]